MWEIYNLGTGTSYSVNEIIQKITEVSNKIIHTTYVGNRDGDVAKCCADVSKAKIDLQWESKLDLERMCRDAWSWENNLGK